MAAALDHPNIMAQSHELLQRQGPLETERSISIISQVASALSNAHEQGSCTATSSRRTCSSPQRGTTPRPTTKGPPAAGGGGERGGDRSGPATCHRAGRAERADRGRARRAGRWAAAGSGRTGRTELDATPDSRRRLRPRIRPRCVARVFLLTPADTTAPAGREKGSGSTLPGDPAVLRGRVDAASATSTVTTRCWSGRTSASARGPMPRRSELPARATAIIPRSTAGGASGSTASGCSRADAFVKVLTERGASYGPVRRHVYALMRAATSYFVTEVRCPGSGQQTVTPPAGVPRGAAVS
jgi:hypothetical protein